MKMIVGLGNPGKQYNFTRHNMGFLAVDFFAKVSGLEWEKTERFGAVWLKEGDYLMIKPQDFYNDSGRAVQQFAHYFKIKTEDIYIICDDFNLEFGKTRFREKGSDGGNNGLKSVTSCLGTNEYKRLRVGTANDALRKKIGDTDFVLGHLTESEKEILPKVLNEIVARINEFL